MRRKIEQSPKIRTLMQPQSKESPREVVNRIYLTILSRLPTEADLKAVEEYSKSGATRGRDAWIDLAWALINSPEFLLRH